MTAEEIIAEVDAVGGQVVIDGSDLVVRRVPRRLVDVIRERKPEIVDLLQRKRSRPSVEPLKGPPTLTTRSVMCAVCHKIDLCYRGPAGRYVCPRCVEWHVAGCATFTILNTADVEAERRFGTCLACGASWELHGRPRPVSWRRVRDLDDVQLVAVRYVIATAAAIIRGER